MVLFYGLSSIIVDDELWHGGTRRCSDGLFKCDWHVEHMKNVTTLGMLGSSYLSLGLSLSEAQSFATSTHLTNMCTP